MKALKKLSQNQLIAVLILVFVVVLGVVLYLTSNTSGTVEEFDSDQTPPLVTIDTGYNATLSGEPFYIVTDDDEDMFDDSLDTCDVIGDNDDRVDLQNGWYQVVAYDDNMTVEEVIFSQIAFEEGDSMVAVIYDADEQAFRAMPNKIIIDPETKKNVDILEFNEVLEKGTVIAVAGNNDVEFCADYEEVGEHENLEKGWNLVSKPDFEKVDYRAIWEVAFAKGGDSGVDPERYYSYVDPDDSVDVADLEADELYWVYGGEAVEVTGGGELPEEELVCNSYEIRVTADYTNYTPSNSDQENLETNVANSLDEQPWLYATYDNADEFKENLTRLEGEGAVVEGKCSEENQSETNTLNGLVVDADTQSPLSAAQVTVSGNTTGVQTDNDGKFSIDTTESSITLNVSATGYQSKVVTFSDFEGVKTIELELPLTAGTNPVCTQELRYGVILEVRGVDNNLIDDATVIVADAQGQEIARVEGAGINDKYLLLPESEGEYNIIVEKAGVNSEQVKVMLEKDECHVITQEVRVDLIDQSLVTLLEDNDVVGFGPVDSLVTVLEKPDGAENFDVIVQFQEQLSSEISSIDYDVRALSNGKIVFDLNKIEFVSGESSGQINLQVQFAKDGTQAGLENSVTGIYRIKVDKP